MSAFEFFIESEPEAVLAEEGRLLFARGIDFVLGVAAMTQLPVGDRLEVCFAGRSNVGKSSLINAVTGRKGLARASNTPGRTQQLNFFNIDDKLYLVDLPGYGFAKAPVKVVETWQRLLKSYLSGRASLRRVFVLIDGRHGPRPADLEIMKLLDSAAVTFQAVLTKADKSEETQLKRAIDATQAELRKHPAAFPALLVTSSASGRGIATVRAAIAALLRDGGVRQ
jgi:GTP-binding protein